MTGIDVCLTVSAEVRLWNSLETKWFCHSKSWSFQNRSEVADPRRLSLLSLCGCMMMTCLSLPVNQAWFRNAALTSEEITCLEKVTAQIPKVIIFWQKCDDLTCQHLSFACLWESWTSLLKPSNLVSNISSLFFLTFTVCSRFLLLSFKTCQVINMVKKVFWRPYFRNWNKNHFGHFLNSFT